MRGWLLAVVMTAVARPAGADETGPIETRKLVFAEKGGRLVASGSFTDVFDEALLGELGDGLPMTIVLRAYVTPQGATRPVAFVAASYRVVFDLWEERYHVLVSDGRSDRSALLATRAEALRAVTSFAELPVADLAAVTPGRQHFLLVIVEANPVSQELLAEVRRWLARPEGQGDVAGNASLFGAVVSIFVNPRLEEAERVLRFRSQLFYRVPQ